MKIKSTINRIVSKAEKLQENENYFDAFSEWDNVVTELNIIIQQTKTSRMISKAGGWVAALVTGGFGVEDIFIVPAINKGLMLLFDVDLKFIVRKLSYSLNQRQSCLYNCKDLIMIAEYKQELTYFAYSYSIANSVADIRVR